MNVEDDEFSPFGGFSSGCDLHGEDFLRECTMCGIEFCSACFPNSALCPDCAAQGEFDDDEEEAQAPAEEKELLLLDGIIDVETEAVGEEPAPAAPPKAVPPPKRPAKASPKAKSKAKSAPKAKRKAKKPARPAPKKAKAKAKAKPRKKR